MDLSRGPTAVVGKRLPGNVRYQAPVSVGRLIPWNTLLQHGETRMTETLK